MNKFTIFSICTENYKDAMEFVLSSWLRYNSIEKIYIYTDFDYNYTNNKVVILNKIKKLMIGYTLLV
jgi:hypothetical protein